MLSHRSLRQFQNSYILACPVRLINNRRPLKARHRIDFYLECQRDRIAIGIRHFVSHQGKSHFRRRTRKRPRSGIKCQTRRHRP